MTRPSSQSGHTVLPFEQRLVTFCSEFNLSVALAESCTGGLIAVRITNIPGASSIFKGGIVSYANEVKQNILGVSQTILDNEGAVSLTCAEAMAAGARKALHADIAVSVTGIAGPGGGTPIKPVGLVFIGVATQARVYAREHLFTGDRASIRQQASDAALQLALEAAAHCLP
jgi:PncC family amidohydrolase